MTGSSNGLPLSTSSSNSFFRVITTFSDIGVSSQQKNIHNNASAALLALIGDEWGQHGNIVFFLQGAYQNKDGNVQTFQYV